VNILLDGIFYNGHGLAEGNRILLRILDRAGFRVRIHPRDKADKHNVLDPAEYRYISSFENTVLSSKDLYLYNWVGTHARYRPDFRINIARTTFESDRIPEQWVTELNKFDEVWVQSSFNKETFKSSGVKVPMRRIPNFFDIRRYTPRGPKLALPVEESFLFLSVFDMKRRKGYDLLLEAFLDEFSQEEGAALIMKIRDPSKSGLAEELIASHPKPSKEKPAVYIIDQMLTTEELHGLYRSCHAFVLPTRGEGWGRPYFEAMLMELPVIGTNWSGHTDFMTEQNSYLVEVDRLEEITENVNPAFIGHCWAEPSLKDLRRKMRMVFKRKAEARAKGRRARHDLLTAYSMQATSNQVISEVAKFSHASAGFVQIGRGAE